MPGGGLDHKEVIEQVVQRQKIKTDDVETVIKDLDEKKREEIKSATKDPFEKTIKAIRTSGDYSKISTPENALILKTYAVLFLGVKSADIGGINNQFDSKALAILRKCQADNIGELKAVKGVDTSGWDKIKPGTEAKTAPAAKAAGASAETPAAVADETTDKSITGATPIPPSVDTASVTETQDARDVVKDLTEKLGQTQFEFNGIPAPLRVDTGKIQIIAVEGKTGIYEVQSPDLGNVTKDKIYVDKDGRLVTAEGKTEDVKLNVSMPNSLIRLGSLFGNEDAKRLKEFIAKANVKDGEYTVSQSEGKVSLKLNESSIAKA